MTELNQATPTTFEAKFNFRTIKELDFAKLQDDLDSEEAKAAAGNEDNFDVTVDEKGTKAYKRKTVTAQLALPTFLDAIPSQLAREAIQELVSKFVKSRYVDKFLPVAEHDWAFIESELAKTGNRVARYDISEETWSLASESFKAFMLTQFGDNPVAAQAASRLGEVMKAKASKNAITKQLNSFNEELVEKLKARVVAWATYAAEYEQDNLEAFADVYSMVTERLEGYVKALNEAKIDFADVL